MFVNWADIGNNLVATIIWAIVLFLVGLLIKQRASGKRLDEPNRGPFVCADFDSKRINEDWTTNISVKNVGTGIARNVYIFLAEKNSEGTVQIQNLGSQRVRIGALSVGETQEFNDKSVMFNGCNVTSLQEVWIDYDDIDGVSWRTIITPPSPRGDDWGVDKPRVIKDRPPQIPGGGVLISASGDNDKQWDEIRSGNAESVKSWNNLR